MGTSYANLTDEELISLLVQHDAIAFKEIYDRYWDKLYNAAYKRIKNAEQCEEIIQDIFTKLWQKRENLVINTGLSNYLFVSVRYLVIDYYRKITVRASFITHGQLNADFDNSTEEFVHLNDLKKQIDLLIDGLPEKCKAVYRLSRIDFKTNKEIAEMLGISEKTVEGHLTKALQHLRSHISDLLPILVAIMIR